MKKMITLFAVLGMVFALAPAAQATMKDPNVVPADGYDVGAYRIAFNTIGKYRADLTDITAYDAYVEAEIKEDLT